MKKGFTLIELLAVIVILAIIAVIAVPIVLNIIDETKNNATLRSAEMYLNAVEMSIAQATLKDKNITDGEYNVKDGDICLNDDCTDKLDVEVNGKTPESGTITIKNGNIKGLNITLNEKEIYKNSKGEMIYVKLLDEVCELKDGIPKTAGAKYECKVDPNKEPYTFYVLTTPASTDTTINLIMDQNINSDGTPAGIIGINKTTNPSKYNLMAWINDEDYDCKETNCANINKGPITAMNFLKEATKNWTNTNEMTINSFNVYDFEGTKNLVDTKIMKEYNVYARMPYLNELSDRTDSNAYLYENFNPQGSSPIFGYWVHAAQGVHPDSVYVFYVFSTNSVTGSAFDARYENGAGVRPVINLKI